MRHKQERPHINIFAVLRPRIANQILGQPNQGVGGQDYPFCQVLSLVLLAWPFWRRRRVGQLPGQGV